MATSKRAAVPATPRVKTVQWEDLTEVVQLKTLKDLWKDRSMVLRRDYPNVASVGLGHKTVRGERQSLLCLAFLVDRKTKSGRQLPKFIRTKARYRGRWISIDVPTDVEELGDSGPHQGINTADGVLVTSPSNPAMRLSGAICCTVKLEGQPDLYVLSCHHVLTLSETVGGCSAAQDATVYTMQFSPFARLAEYFPLQPGPPSQVDAAIALVMPGQQVTWNHSGMQPNSVNMGDTKPPEDCTIYAPGKLLVATYIKTWPDATLDYPGCGQIRFDCYQFAANTRKGDSGSPVISSDGTLQAMHFWGDDGGTFSLAIPAGYIFNPGVFESGDLVLA